MNTARLAAITAFVTLGLIAIGSAATAGNDAGTTSIPPPTSFTTPAGGSVSGEPPPAPDKPGAPVPPPAPAPAPPPAPAPTGGIGIDGAIRIALDRAGGGRVTDAEWDAEYGRSVWEIEIVNAGVEHDVRVDADSGAVLRHKRDADWDHDWG